MERCSSSLGLFCASCPFIFWMFFVSQLLWYSCHSWDVPLFLSTYHLFDVTLAISWYLYLNKEDIFCDRSPFLLSFLPSLITLPSSGWTAAACRRWRLMVFGVGGLPSGRCSLAGRRVTDSRRSLVPRPAHPAGLSGLAWISRRPVTAIFNNSRYSWKTCGQREGNEQKAKWTHLTSETISQNVRPE